MKLILTYRGKLKSNGNAKHKNEIRMAFHHQIKRASEIFTQLSNSKKYISFHTKRGTNKYYQLVNSEFHLLADIDILLLRKGPLGQLVKGGDIDNRLKTLLDALTVPTVDLSEQLNNKEEIYCLLEDDKLIRSLSIKSEPILNLSVDEKDSDEFVELIITVNTSFSKVTIENIDFA